MHKNKIKDNWLIFDNNNSLSEFLSQEVLDIAKISINKKGFFNIVLTGGQSCINLYKTLAKANSNWSKWYIYLGDERFLPKKHKNRNDEAINKIWLDGSLIPKKNINFIQAELGLVRAKNKYERVLNNIDKFDVVLLGVGEDGHIASLFPNCKYPKNQNVVIEMNSPKLPKERISISYEKLNKAHNVFKIIVGKSKQTIVKMLLQGELFPVSAVNGETTKVLIHNNAMAKSDK